MILIFWWGWTKTVALAAMIGSWWENEWFGVKKLKPNVHPDTVEKLSSRAIYWCNTIRVVPV
jgi:hypothetical protein